MTELGALWNGPRASRWDRGVDKRAGQAARSRRPTILVLSALAAVALALGVTPAAAGEQPGSHQHESRHDEAHHERSAVKTSRHGETVAADTSRHDERRAGSLSRSRSPRLPVAHIHQPNGASPWPLIPMGLASGLAVLLVVRWRRARVERAARWPSAAAALGLATTGVLHCVEAAPHWVEGWHLGAFFAVSGGALVALAIGTARTPSRFVLHLGLVAVAGLIALYFAARELSLPFVPHIEPYDALGLWTKAVEAAVIGSIATALWGLRAPARAPSRSSGLLATAAGTRAG